MAWLLTGVLLFSIRETLADTVCHCNTTAACAVFPSTPCSQVGDPDRCQEGWFGTHCQRQNIALGRPANQSSTYSRGMRNTEQVFEAKYGVDGRVTTDFNSMPVTCTHTLEGNQTWTVNLNISSTDKIQHVKMYLRNTYRFRNNGMRIYVGGELCYKWPRNTSPPVVADIKCQQALSGNSLTIQNSNFLVLCEVQIFVCSDGWFGNDCDKQCRCSQNTEICDKITGQCLSGCAPGYVGQYCQTECPDGYYGDCTSKCGNCLNAAYCNKATGICPGGCEAGWQSDTCLQLCGDGWFGEDCDKQCHCSQNTEVCDKITGQCRDGCAPGYMGTDCQTACTEGRYGANCPSPCGHCQGNDICDKVTGKCPGGYQPGWWPDLCSQVCSVGRYGHHCQLECGQCKGNLPCNKINGTCDQGCRPGFQEPFCKECIDGMYGADCMSRCGQCKDVLTCDKSSGECPGGCQGNFMKPLCQGCTECSATPRCSNQVVPVAATLGTLLALALIALLTSVIYIRRLKIQLDASLKRPEDNYTPLDERTKEPVVENTYEDIDSATPYTAALEVPQGRAKTK